LENEFLKHKKMRFVIGNFITPEEKMVVHPILHPVVAIIAGILILIFPALLNYIVAFYLIIVGVAGIAGSL
jgi:Protein of unknown function (DUF3096)